MQQLPHNYFLIMQIFSVRPKTLLIVELNGSRSTLAATLQATHYKWGIYVSCWLVLFANRFFWSFDLLKCTLLTCLSSSLSRSVCLFSFNCLSFLSSVCTQYDYRMIPCRCCKWDICIIDGLDWLQIGSFGHLNYLKSALLLFISFPFFGLYLSS